MTADRTSHGRNSSASLSNEAMESFRRDAAKRARRGVFHWLERRYKSIKRRVSNYVRSWILPLRDQLAYVGCRRWLAAPELNELPVQKCTLLLIASSRDTRAVRRTLRSLERQLDSNWELLVAAPAELFTKLGARWNALVARRVARRVDLPAELDTSHTDLPAIVNRAWRESVGQWFGLIEPGDTLSADALLWLRVIAHQHPDMQWFYSDESLQVGRRVYSQLKPDFSVEHLVAQPFVGSLSLYSRELLLRLAGTPGGNSARGESPARSENSSRTAAGPFHAEYGDACLYDAELRASELLEPSQIVHLPERLYHRRERSQHRTLWRGVTEQRLAASRAAIARRHWPATCEIDPDTRLPRIRFQLAREPQVTILIATRNHVDYCRECVQSLRDQAGYSNYDIVVIDNQSDEPELLEWLEQQERAGVLRVHRYDHPFNHSAMHNEVVAQLHSDYVVLLNNDVWGFSYGWLAELVATAEADRSVGVVGAQLIYPDDTIQHGGVVHSHRGAGHAHISEERFSPGLQSRLHCLQEYSAVTAALALVRRDLFARLGGFDADRFPTSFNDVDFCFRVREQGLRCLYNPSVQAYHFESKSRGRSPKEAEYSRRFRERWAHVLQHDPFYQARRGEPNRPGDRWTKGEKLVRCLAQIAAELPQTTQQLRLDRAA